MLYFLNSEAAAEHMEKYYEGVNGGILTGNDLMEWTAMLDGKRNSAMVNGNHLCLCQDSIFALDLNTDRKETRALGRGRPGTRR